MKKLLSAIFILIGTSAFAGTMFDDSGNYSGNWKQMTNVSSGSSSQSYSSSSYSTSNWYKNQRETAQKTRSATYSTPQSTVTPFRYNTLDYKRIRQVKGGHGDYSAKCTDIGDASFCQ